MNLEIEEGEWCGYNSFEDNNAGECKSGLECVFEGFGGYGTCTKVRRWTKFDNLPTYFSDYQTHPTVRRKFIIIRLKHIFQIIYYFSDWMTRWLQGLTTEF